MPVRVATADDAAKLLPRSRACLYIQPRPGISSPFQSIRVRFDFLTGNRKRFRNGGEREGGPRIRTEASRRLVSAAGLGEEERKGKGRCFSLRKRLGDCSRAPGEEVISPFLPSVAARLFSCFHFWGRFRCDGTGSDGIERSQVPVWWEGGERGSACFSGYCLRIRSMEWFLVARGWILLVLRLDLRETDRTDREFGLFRCTDLVLVSKMARFRKVFRALTVCLIRMIQIECYYR
jgi:hypothetical protein